jgi:hypothetical protein
VKVIKSKSKVKKPNNSKKRKVTPQEQRYSGNFRNPKPGLLSNSLGFYGGNYGDRNSFFVNQNSLSLNIGGETFNQSTKNKDTFMNKTMRSEQMKKNQNLGSMKSKSTQDKIGCIQKSGPIKATISTEKVRMSKYEHLSNKYVAINQKYSKPARHAKRPHSSTFIGNKIKEVDMHLKQPPETVKQKSKGSKDQSKKKMNKRVRSASPGGLKNVLSQKPACQKMKNQRIIGGHLYQAKGN